jgi:hypothetical protein
MVDVYDHLAGSGPGQPVPDALVAHAARILGLESPVDSGPAEPEPTAKVIVTGPEGQAVLDIALGSPAGSLATRLGAAVGVRDVECLRLQGGSVLAPHDTLASHGVTDGTVIVVDDAVSAAITGIPAVSYDDPTTWAGPTDVVSRLRRRLATSSLRQRAIAAVVAAIALVLVTVAATAGGSAPVPRALPVVAQAQISSAVARDWLADTPYRHARAAGVPMGLGRSGAAFAGTLEPAGSTTIGALSSERFIVSPTTGSPYGLTVVLRGAQLAYVPTITGLPFASPAGAVVPETGRPERASSVAEAATWATAWATTTFGPGSTGAASVLGFALAGNVTVLSQWHPSAGAALVARVEIPLSNTAAGTPAANAVASATAVLTATQTTVSSDQAAVAAANSAAQAAVAAAPPGSPAPLTAAAAAAQTKAVAAQAKLTGDQATETADQTALSAAQQTESTEMAGVVSVYDVAFNATGTALAWSPPAYGTGGS